MLGEQALDIQASTFHSACMRILRREITALGYERSFTVYDTDDSVRIIKEALKELAIQEKVMAPKGILASISAAKDQLLSPERYAAKNGQSADPRQRKICEIYTVISPLSERQSTNDFGSSIETFTTRPFFSQAARYAHVVLERVEVSMSKIPMISFILITVS